MIGNYHSIETFSSVDGPGIRYVLFLQGCNLRCSYCHNPDMLALKTNKTITVDEVVKDYQKYHHFYKQGGITVSGGEPLLQIDFLISLFREFKKLNVHTCIETQGTLFTDNPKYYELVKVTDLFIVNIKGVDNDYAKAISNQGIDKTLAFLDFLKKQHANCMLTYVLLPTLNDNEECAQKLASIIKTYQPQSFQILPYHKLGISKWNKLNIPYELQIASATNEDVNNFLKLIQSYLSIKVA
ncbi:MAG TPA: pyruvate formate-lyase-activating protein [Bacilli bacterium]